MGVVFLTPSSVTIGYINEHSGAAGRSPDPLDGKARVNYPRHVDRTMPPPDVLATDVPIDTLDGTAKSLATAALRAGYTLRITRALGPRTPRQTQQDIERVASLALTGAMAGWRFTAIHTHRDGWDVTLHRPGWPPEVANVTRLRTLFAAQTPATIR